MNRHSNDLRVRAIEYINSGNTVAKTSRVFHIAISTLRKWREEEKTGILLQPKQYVSMVSRIDTEALKSFIQDNSDMYYSEIAKHFQISKSQIHRICVRLGITVKKNKKYLKKQTLS
jgi:transposase-like protein